MFFCCSLYAVHLAAAAAAERRQNKNAIFQSSISVCSARPHFGYIVFGFVYHLSSPPRASRRSMIPKWNPIGCAIAAQHAPHSPSQQAAAFNSSSSTQSKVFIYSWMMVDCCCCCWRVLGLVACECAPRAAGQMALTGAHCAMHTARQRIGNSAQTPNESKRAKANHSGVVLVGQKSILHWIYILR